MVKETKTVEKLKTIKNNRINTRFCPLCGSEAKMESSTYDPWGDGGGKITDYWCECSGCGIIKAGAFSTYNDNPSEAQQKAKKDWNETIDYLNSIIIFKEKEGKE